MPRKFRFGVINTGGTLAEWQAFARKAQDLGFSTIITQDHFGQQFAPLPALMAAAAVTSTIRLGTIVLDNDFRHPAVLAKDVATMDVLTGGRMELGLGAGWMQGDYRQTGLPYDPPGERLTRLEEAVAICRALFAGETLTHQGRHYQIDGLTGFPKAAQPRLPIMIGGRQRRMLNFAGREADIVGISLLDRVMGGAGPAPTYAQKLEWVREGAGARFAELEIHVNAGNFVVTDDRAGTLAQIAARLETSVEEALDSPGVIVGNADACVERLHQLRERYGCSYFVVNQRVMDAVAPVVAKASGK